MKTFITAAIALAAATTTHAATLLHSTTTAEVISAPLNARADLRYLQFFTESFFLGDSHIFESYSGTCRKSSCSFKIRPISHLI